MQYIGQSSIRKAASKCAFSAGGMEYCIGIVTTTDYSKNEFEKFQLRGSDNLFDDFLLYGDLLTFAHTHAIISNIHSEGELFVKTTAG